jgi:hypothetical protein
VAGALVAASGCSGGGSSAAESSAPPLAGAPATSAAAATTQVATTTTLPVTTTTLSEAEVAEAELKAAQAAYFTFSSEINGVIVTVWEPWPEGAPWAELPGICAVLAPAVERFATQLAGYDWPADAQDEVDAQVAVKAKEAGLYYSCASSPGTQAGQSVTWAALEDPAAVAESSAAASATRLALGLPIDRG